MGLNPVQFGKDVITQYGRYLKGNFPLVDEGIKKQFDEKLQTGDANLISKGPFIYLNKPFVEGAKMRDLESELALHPVLKDVFPFEAIHRHQEKALRAVNAGKNLIVSTGTGSGKTESFLLPIVDYCLKHRAQNGMVAIIVYPMNALVNDQLERLRFMLAGTGVTFGRYTGETNQNTSSRQKLETSRKYSQEEMDTFNKTGEIPLPFEECFTREEILKNKPQILLTNYSQLEYLLLRDKDLELFRTPTLQFMVYDEVHTYTGALGSEVACLNRRIKSLFPATVQCIGTSATVANKDSSKVIRNFASKLFGVTDESIEVVEEEYKERDIDTFITSKLPSRALDLAEDILQEARAFHLQEEVDEISDTLLGLAVELTGIEPPATGKNIDKCGYILAHSEYIRQIENEFSTPKIPSEGFKRIRTIGDRKSASEKVLEAELLSYLTLGAIVRFDNEPVIRPKLHYFVKGLNEATLSYEDAQSPTLHFTKKSDTKSLKFDVKICRTCGQHYHEGIFDRDPVSENGVGVYTFNESRRDYQKIDPMAQSAWLFTHRLYNEEYDGNKMELMYLCKHCGALHKKNAQGCQNSKCRNTDSLIEVHAIEVGEAGAEKCQACGMTSRNDYLPITQIRTTEVLDVMILAQTMLSSMNEEELKKILIFADGRQDAAFTASWMSERSKRFYLRFIAHKIIESFESPYDEALSYDGFVSRLSIESETRRIYPGGGFKQDELSKRIRWFLIDEFYSSRQRVSLEQLGMVSVLYDGISNSELSEFEEYVDLLGLGSMDELKDIIHNILDFIRKRGAVSDELAKRKWNEKDLEVRDGVIPFMKDTFPHAIFLASNSDEKTPNYIHAIKSKNGRSSVQEMLKKSVIHTKHINTFLDKLWDFAIDTNLLVNVDLVFKGYNGETKSLFDAQRIYQLNKDKIGFQHAQGCYECQVCKKVYIHALPTLACPTYNCKGRVVCKPLDKENYDVFQYTSLKYSPIKPEEHSAQVGKEKREEIEKEFKKVNGTCNALVATPTLEMGVDIGKLEMVLLKNVPPSTPNYTQRVGRAGRKHRIATVFTYCKNASHDSYFFENPAEMITGNIRIPTFSMSNQNLVRKHVHSAILTWLRSNVKDQELLKEVFPTYISRYISYNDEIGNAGFKEKIDDFNALAKVIEDNFESIYSDIKKIFFDHWTLEDKESINEEFLKSATKEVSSDLKKHLDELMLEIKTYRSVLMPYRSKEVMNKAEEREFNAYNRALNSYLSDKQDNYTLSYLAKDGFFPSYALGRESVRAVCVEPLFEISRANTIAIRELTPANKVYANKNIFEITRLNFAKIKEKEVNFSSEDIRKDMILETSSGAILENFTRDYDGGDKEYQNFFSFPMVDIVLNKVQKIDDLRESRVRVGFKTGSLILDKHFGGTLYEIGKTKIKYLKNGNVRLINLGIYGQKELGFLICPSCGSVRHPKASEAEIANFMEEHKKRCFIRDTKFFWNALHTDLESDLIIFEGFESASIAANFLESLKLGAIEILDVREFDIDGVVESKDNGQFNVVFYDSLPGGSGYLSLFLDNLPLIVEKAIAKLNACDCEDVCYKCLLNYGNQQYHNVLNRIEAINLLENYKKTPIEKMTIPNNAVPKKSENKTDSPAEEAFLDILRKNNFPDPTQQYEIELRGNETTIADFAYIDKKVLIYIDGLSTRYHGNPVQAEKDKIKRTKAKLLGWEVLEIAANALKDESLVEMYLELLAGKIN